MNLVVLSSCSPVNTCLINLVARRHPIRHAFRVVWDERESAESRWSKLARNPMDAVLNRLRRKFYDRYLAGIESQATRYIVDKGMPLNCDPPSSSIDRLRVNGKEFAQMLRATQPDILLVSGCPLLKPAIISIPRLGTINIHRGIAPAYRGERTIFWPLYNGDFDSIGVTLHLIDRGIDTGAVLGYGFPELAPRDTEASILAKSIEVAADLVGHALENAEAGRLAGVRQTAKGRCYYRREQRIWKDLRYLVSRAVGLRAIPRRPRRIEMLFERQLDRVLSQVIAHTPR